MLNWTRQLATEQNGIATPSSSEAQYKATSSIKIKKSPLSQAVDCCWLQMTLHNNYLWTYTQILCIVFHSRTYTSRLLTVSPITVPWLLFWMDHLGLNLLFSLLVLEYAVKGDYIWNSEHIKNLIILMLHLARNMGAVVLLGSRLFSVSAISQQSTKHSCTTFDKIQRRARK